MASKPLKLSLFLVIFSLLHISHSQYQCNIDTTVTNMTLGGSAVICLHFVLPTTQNTTKTYAFNVTVDKFSALKVSGMKDLLVKQNQQSLIYVQFQNNATFYQMKAFIPKEAKISSNDLYQDVFSFVINLQDGNATSIALDNANCDVCDTASGNQECIDETTCYSVTKTSTYGNGTAQDPKVFVSWIGTDSEGNHMLSHTKRLSRFTQYSVGSIYQKAKGLVIQQ